METKVPELLLPLDGTQVKKASKKAVATPPPNGGVPDAGVLASSSGLPTGLEVPRLNLSADPKNATGNPAVLDQASEKAAKARAAKKATAPPPTTPGASTPPGSAGPSTGSSGIDSAAFAATAKNDAAAARELEAKREAKRLKQKEVEEAKKKEELQRRALEEVKFQQEQRQRDARIQQERAALRANAEECQEEEDYDDDFENYEGDDFEKDSEDLHAQVKPGAAAKPTSAKQAKLISNAEAAEFKKIQEALQAERKELGAKPTAGSSSVKKTSDHDQFQTQSTGATGSSPASSSAASSRLAGLKQAMDPRAKRVKDILENRKFQSEKLHLFQLEPFTPLEWFGNRIRRGLLRQVASQTNDDAKHVAVQTKAKEQIDVSNQFPDDLGSSTSSNSINDRKKNKVIRAGRFGGSKAKKKAPLKDLTASNQDIDRDDAEDYVPQEPENDPDEDEDEDDEDGANDFGNQSTQRFFRFLQQAGNVCEILVEQNVLQHHEKMFRHGQNQSKRKALESPFKGKQVVLASKPRNLEREEKKNDQQESKEENAKAKEDTSQTSNGFWRRVLAKRTLVSMQFASELPHILLCSYGVAPEADAAYSSVTAMLTKSDSSRNLNHQLLTRRSVSCIWDLNQPEKPLFLLRNEGVVTTTILGPTRELFVIAGTEDGSIHVWDTREQAYLQETNVLVPSYSTCGMHETGSSNHVSSIVSLQVVHATSDKVFSGSSSHKFSLANHSTSTSSFQFGSLDDRGIFILWSVIEYPKGDGALFLDKCVEIGGRIKLVINALIETHKAFPSTNQLVPSIGPITSIFRFVPQDPNRFVIGSLTGQIAVFNRFDAIQPKQAARMASKPKSASVVAMDFHPFVENFLLVGYSNGMISVVSLEKSSRSVYDWPFENFTTSAMGFVPTVCSVQWSTTASSMFFAGFSNGQIMGWDLRHETNQALWSFQVDQPTTPAASPLDDQAFSLPLSVSHSKFPPVFLAFRNASQPFQLEIRSFVPQDASCVNVNKAKQEAQEMHDILSRLY